MKSEALSQAWFKSLLDEEGLSDLDQFFKPGFFDEIPFYSRYSQLESFNPSDPDKVSCLLLDSCLDFMDSLLAHREPQVPFFAALTVTRDDRRSPIVPALFCCCGDQVGSLPDQLSLTRPRSMLAIFLSKTLGSSDRADDFEIFQDSVTVPRHPRIFIGCRNLASDKMVRLSDLVRTSKPISKKLEYHKHSINP